MKWLLGAAVLCVAVLVAAQGIQRPRRISLIVNGRFVITENDARQILSPGSVAIDGDSIVGVDAPDVIAGRFTANDTINVTDDVVLPGLINTHTHAPMVMYRGLADDLSLMDWLNQYIFPAEAKTVSPEIVASEPAGGARDDWLGDHDLH
jgi:5-methylthioadenosine/S-adenosylhomocysteine deaminase